MAKRDIFKVINPFDEGAEVVVSGTKAQNKAICHFPENHYLCAPIYRSDL